MLTGTRLEVWGDPIAHSRSPQLHAAAYEVLGLDWTYDAVDVGNDELAEFLDGLTDDWRGLSLTMPLKRTAVPLVDERLSSLSAAPAFTRAAWSAGNPPATRLESAIRPSTNSMIR